MKTIQVELPDEVYERANRRAEEMGMSLADEVESLVRKFGEVGSDPRGTRESLREGIASIAAECQSPNWDAQGAAPVATGTLRHAERFAGSLPADVPTPTVGVEADGHLTFEWYRDPNWLLSVSVGPDSDMYYAALFGASDVRGRETFDSTVPDIILGLIRRVHSQ